MYDAGDPFVRGHIVRALYDRLRMCDASPLALPKGFRVNSPVIGHTMVGRTVQETEKSTAVTMSWFHGAPRVDVIDGTTGQLLDEHVYVWLLCVNALVARWLQWLDSVMFSSVQFNSLL